MVDLERGQADQRGKIPSFDSIPLNKIAQYLTDARDEGKFVFIADMHGNAHTFITYSAEFGPYEFGSQVKKCIIAKTQTFEEASENVRAALVKFMRSGKQMIFHTETMVPDFAKYDNAVLPLKNLVFKRE